MSDLRLFGQNLPDFFETFRNELTPLTGFFSYPPVDISENETELVIKAEVPGVDPKNLDLLIGEKGIILKAFSNESKEYSKEGYRRFERRSGSFERSISYPMPVLYNESKASLKNGLLEIRIPKDQTKYHNMKKLNIELSDTNN
ncbi:MAG: Hsp20/alpha crystallin family protein [Firmicutes bacterium]|nr:Hsp20/alpha crystallin family protein [Bacillota bacterium]MDD4693654.1 Hsp20/alpha crystallin family protein [Bacillota bacterium]